MMNKNIYTKAFSLILALPVLMASGCKEDEEYPFVPLDPTSYVLTVNAVPDANLDVYINNKKANVAAGVPFVTPAAGTTAATTASSANMGAFPRPITNRATYFYEMLPAAAAPVAVTLNAASKEQNAALDAAATPVLTQQQVEATADKAYSVFVYGTASEADAIPVQSKTVADDLTIPANGQIRFRVAHLSPGAPNVDVLTGATVTGATSGAGGTVAEGTAVTGLQNLAYGTVSDFVSVPLTGTSLQLTVRQNGGASNVYTLNATGLAQGKIYTFVVGGFVNAPAGKPAVGLRRLNHN
jgi:Domain of unknown function (DUF4397)